MKISHLLACLLLALFSCKNTQFSSVAKYNNQLPGQSAPPDMIFVPGNDSIESFYIGVIEEPNISYVMYLRWLLTVHLSHPEIFTEALPQTDNGIGWRTPDETHVVNYLLNPRCAYYPVTGLTWLQIQKYLQWKTDRLNEAILIESGVFEENVDEQFDDNNFNTEAYLYGQYSPSYKKVLSDNGQERQVQFSDGILFTGFRLPTLSEWQMAKRMEVEPPVSSSSKPIMSSKHIFGDEYYPLVLENRSGYGDEYYGIESAIWSYETDFKNLEFGSVAGNVDSVSQVFATMILNYPKKAYGPVNMDKGVSEWLLNGSEDPKASWFQAYKKSGFKTYKEAAVLQWDGTMYNKDSIGRMRFRMIGVDGFGYIPIGHKCVHETIRVRDTIIIPDSLGSGMDSMDVPKYHQRLIMNSSTGQLDSLPENKWRNDVGFRCILPYTGAPVRKGFKVKW